MRLAAFTIVFVLAMAFPLAPVLGGEGGGEGPDLAGPSNSDPHPPSPPSTGERSKAFATTLPAMLQDVGIDQNIGAQVPADLVFRDESGKRVKLGDYYGKRPIVL